VSSMPAPACVDVFRPDGIARVSQYTGFPHLIICLLENVRRKKARTGCVAGRAGWRRLCPLISCRS